MPDRKFRVISIQIVIEVLEIDKVTQGKCIECEENRVLLRTLRKKLKKGQLMKETKEWTETGKK